MSWSAIRILGSLSAVCFLGAAYFALDLFVGAPEIAEVIILPIYIGIALIVGALLGAIALLLWLWRR